MLLVVTMVLFSLRAVRGPGAPTDPPRTRSRTSRCAPSPRQASTSMTGTGLAAPARDLAARRRNRPPLLRRPDYDAYVDHLRAHHPDRPVPSYATFFRERQAARYRGTSGRCC